MITPYRADGSVDIDTARRYVDFYARGGMDGIFAVCQSSEIFYLTLEERAALARAVYREAKSCGRGMTVVSSGHVSDSLQDQIRELNTIADAGTDGLILISNRLARQDESDDVWIANAERLIRALPDDVPLGVYECPYPYKRLMTEKLLRFCVSTGRFRFMKDTCCDAAEIARRTELLRGTPFRLYNANCQTLLASLRSGAAGYCGVMANFHPRLYARLCHTFDSDPAGAESLQALLGTLGYTEGGLPYPLSAKYSMTLNGIPTENISRSRPSSDLTDYYRESVRQMKVLTDEAEKRLHLSANE